MLETAKTPSGPVRLLKPKTSYLISALAGGMAGHTVSLAGMFLSGPGFSRFDFNDLVVTILVSISSYFIAVIPITLMALMMALPAAGLHHLLRATGLDYRYVLPVAGAVLALVAVNLFFGLSDGFAAWFAKADRISVISSLTGGAIAGHLFWRMAVRPLHNAKRSPGAPDIEIPPG